MCVSKKIEYQYRQSNRFSMSVVPIIDMNSDVRLLKYRSTGQNNLYRYGNHMSSVIIKVIFFVTNIIVSIFIYFFDIDNVNFVNTLYYLFTGEIIDYILKTRCIFLNSLYLNLICLSLLDIS